MNSSQRKNEDSWTLSSKLMLITTFLLLAGFSSWSSYAKRYRQTKIDELQKQISVGQYQMQELQSLHERHNAQAVLEVDQLNSRFTKMIGLLQTGIELLPTLEKEFAVFQQNGPAESGEKISLLSVPKQGEHQLRIELWWHKKRIANEIHEIESGKKYSIRFKATERKIEVTFPGRTTTQYQTKGFDPAENLSTGVRPRNHSPFVSANRPSWTKGLVYYSPVEAGIIHEFRFEDRSYGIDDAVTIRLIGESKGPRTAAADDMETVSNLLQMLSGQRIQQPFRFENGRYIFE